MNNEKLKIINHFLPSNCYVPSKTNKTRIVLHHTESSTASSVINWWKQLKPRVATHFIIDKNGSIIRLFNDEYWAWHTGCGTEFDKHSIGIELVNEGKLIKKKDGHYWWGYRYNYKFKPVEDQTVYDLNEHNYPTHRYNNIRWFATYTTAQINSLKKLIKYLLDKYPTIKQEFIFSDVYTFAETEYTKQLKNKLIEDSYKTWLKNKSGILTHSNVKIKKTDLSPAIYYHVNSLSELILKSTDNKLEKKLLNSSQKSSQKNNSNFIKYFVDLLIKSIIKTKK